MTVSAAILADSGMIRTCMGHARDHIYLLNIVLRACSQMSAVRLSPVAPVDPEAPVRPEAPVAPVRPVGPVAPNKPLSPVKPVLPVAPEPPKAPVAPAVPALTVERPSEAGVMLSGSLPVLYRDVMLARQTFHRSSQDVAASICVCHNAMKSNLGQLSP